jgi:hypothetical protein
LLHLSACPHQAVFPGSLCAAVRTVLASDVCADGWLTAHRHLPLEQLLVQLFPVPSTTPPHIHFASLMCGVFSARQANAACKVMGVAPAENGRGLMQQLRLCCVDSVHHFFSALKLALP